MLCTRLPITPSARLDARVICRLILRSSAPSLPCSLRHASNKVRKQNRKQGTSASTIDFRPNTTPPPQKPVFPNMPQPVRVKRGQSVRAPQEESRREKKQMAAAAAEQAADKEDVEDDETVLFELAVDDRVVPVHLPFEKYAIIFKTAIQNAAKQMQMTEMGLYDAMHDDKRNQSVAEDARARSRVFYMALQDAAKQVMMADFEEAKNQVNQSAADDAKADAKADAEAEVKEDAKAEAKAEPSKTEEASKNAPSAEKAPSYLGIPTSYPSPDDPLVSSVDQQGSSKSSDTNKDGGRVRPAQSVFAKYRYGYVLYLGLVSGAFGLGLGGTAYYVLKQYEDSKGGARSMSPAADDDDEWISGGGSRRQRHTYPVSTTIAILSTLVFACKLSFPSLRKTLVKYGYVNLPIFSFTARSTANTPKLSLVLAHFSHRTLASFLASTLALVWLSRETEFLVAPSALGPVLGAGLVSTTVSAALLPRALAGGNQLFLRAINGSSGLACAVLGFLSTFEDAGDVPHYVFLAMLGLTGFRVLAKSKSVEAAGACVLSAWELGGLAGGWAVGKAPDMMLLARKMVSGDTAWAQQEQHLLYRRAFWGMRADE
ncbi:hypothetical protein BZA70DRAFT_277887 [Myxozyma melibiosi]|uniref:Peptidase S54 rhomboid domain-containing protein n=1 Tax=Myxozyma melibiosi TaxID=54550 RepID=A0ABR1F689_9ASCO